MASLVPTSRLSSVDLPAFGRPMNETRPNLWAMRLSLDGRLVFHDPDLVDAAAFGVEHFDGQPVDVEPLAHGRHAAEVREKVPADRLKPFPLDVHVEPPRDL